MLKKYSRGKMKLALILMMLIIIIMKFNLKNNNEL
jgi:hypothetical protein